MTGSIFLAGLLGLLTMQLTNPTDISGNWTGESWQHVSLASVDEASDWYSGTFVDSDGRRGAVRLEWSRLQKRYNGRWKVGDAEAGHIILRAGENGTLRGAVSVDPESQLEPAVPRLLEFTWNPASKKARQEFESQTAQTQNKQQGSGRQVAGQAVSIKSPSNGVVVRISDGIKLNARVKQGDFIADISPTESNFFAERKEQLSALQRKSEAAFSKIKAAERDVDAAREICAAIEAQIKTLETAKQQAADQPRAELEAQSNLDNALVALKKAEADVVKVETERQSAQEERFALEKEIVDLQTKLQQLNRLRFLAPVTGKITYIATFQVSDTVKVGDVICEVTPDSAQASESPENTESSENTKKPVAPPAPAPATTSTPTTAPVSETILSSPIQSLSAFGPASELAKRLRQSRQRLASIASRTEAGNAKLTAIQQKLLALQEKQSQAREDDVQLRKHLESIEHAGELKRATEEEIRNLNAEQKLVGAELSEAEQEQQFILQILQAKLLAAERQLKFKQTSKERMELSYNEGRSPIIDLSQAEQALAEAESEVRQLELLREFYASLGKNDAEQKSQE